MKYKSIKEGVSANAGKDIEYSTFAQCGEGSKEISDLAGNQEIDWDYYANVEAIDNELSANKVKGKQ